MTTTQIDRDPITPTAEEQAALQALADLLAGGADGAVRLVDADGREMILPDAVVRLLRQAMPLLAFGHAVVVGGLGRCLTLEQAADLLTLTPAQVAGLVEAGALPATTGPAGQEILLADLLAYRAGRAAERRRHLAELTRLSEEMGLYPPEE